ncbi:MAG TPA: response regulator transcription factor [Actinomycetes bacterium]|jgi:DNA-binding NarL/FixJ family response regulator|nr:response regulator transcription factor [Actinomycetes bacterium]
MIRVLLADDNDMLRQALAEALEDHPGIRVVGHASNGRMACSAAVALDPDVVVMDIRLPVMSGPAATAWLSGRCPAVRVVGLTAYDDEALHQAMARAGAVAVLVKGVSINEIVDAILSSAAA